MADRKNGAARKKAALGRASRRAFDFAFSRRCVMCGEALGFYQSGELCARCVGAYADRAAKKCPVCRLDASRCACSKTRAENLGANVTALGFYEGADDAIGRMIYALKRGGSRDLTRFFARSLAAAVIRADGLDAINAVVTYPPRSVASVWEYGFDHAKNLAGTTARYLGADFERTLFRVGGTEQKNLDAAERAQNVSGAFAARPAILPGKNGKRGRLEGRRVILVDDVATTGSTLAEAARTLRAAGCADVRFAVLFLAAERPRDDGALWFEQDRDDGFDPVDPLADDVGF